MEEADIYLLADMSHFIDQGHKRWRTSQAPATQTAHVSARACQPNGNIIQCTRNQSVWLNVTKILLVMFFGNKSAGPTNNKFLRAWVFDGLSRRVFLRKLI